MERGGGGADGKTERGTDFLSPLDLGYLPMLIPEDSASLLPSRITHIRLLILPYDND